MSRQYIPPAPTGSDSKTDRTGVQQSARLRNAPTRTGRIRLEAESDDLPQARPAALSKQAPAFEDPAPITTPVIEVDFSSSGVRVTYAGRPLKPGQIVNFGQLGMMVRAQVLWTRQSGASIQSCLLVMSLDPLDDEARR